MVGYADDISILVRSEERGNETFQELKGKEEEIGLHVNTDKTKVMNTTRRKISKPCLLYTSRCV